MTEDLKTYEVQVLMHFTYNEIIVVKAKNKAQAWTKAKEEAAKHERISEIDLIVECLDDLKLLDIEKLHDN